MTYQIIEDILTEEDVDFSAAEAHGMATGMLCVNNNAQSNDWLNEIFEISQPDQDKIIILTKLFQQTANLLNDENFSFDLFLPDDVSLDKQVIALRAWCQGFLYGLGILGQEIDSFKVKGQKSNIDAWSKDVREILLDVVEFTKMELSSMEESEASEEENAAAFVEIQEYLRAAVYIIWNEFNSDPGVTYH